MDDRITIYTPPTYTVASFFALLEKAELKIILEISLRGVLKWKRLDVVEPLVLLVVEKNSVPHQSLSYIIQKAATLAPIPKAGLWGIEIVNGKIKDAGEMYSLSQIQIHWSTNPIFDISIYEALDRVLPLSGLRMFVCERAIRLIH